MSDENQTEPTYETAESPGEQPEAKEPTGNPVQGSQERAAEQQLDENVQRPLNTEPRNTASPSQGEYLELTDEDGNEQTVTIGHKAGSPVVRPDEDAATAEAEAEKVDTALEVEYALEDLAQAVGSPDTTSPEANYASRNNIVPPEYP